MNLRCIIPIVFLVISTNVYSQEVKHQGQVDILKRLQSEDLNIKLRAIRSSKYQFVYKGKEKQVVKLLIDATKHQNDKIVANALSSLRWTCYLADKKMITLALFELLQHSNPKVCERSRIVLNEIHRDILDALPESGDPIPCLVDSLEGWTGFEFFCSTNADPYFTRRISAATILQYLGEKSIPQLQLALTSNTGSLRHGALVVIMNIRLSNKNSKDVITQSTYNTIVENLSHEHDGVRYQAGETLIVFGKTGIKTLYKVLQSGNLKAQETALWRLWYHDKITLIPILVEKYQKNELRETIIDLWKNIRSDEIQQIEEKLGMETRNFIEEEVNRYKNE
ncbi:HEAT repeat domain-containing protein [Candidatus Uabimicrobium sp. HlEnr_7]|uniref:HEAT repeat domain-containing protein n=1 Tax=Candidatus Uabimicrobium helgolandensis TaxID=3095367 RepID=UPI003557989A